MKSQSNSQELDKVLVGFLDEFNELAYQIRYKNEDLKLLPGDVKLQRQAIIAEAKAKLLQLALSCLPERYELDHPNKYASGFNAAIDTMEANMRKSFK